MIKILLSSSKYMPEYSGSGLRAHKLYKRLLQKSDKFKLLPIIVGSETENSNFSYKYEDFEVNRIAQKKFTKISSNTITRGIQNCCNFFSEFYQTTKVLNKLPEKPDIVHIFGKNYVTTAVLDFAITHSIPLLIELCNEMENPDFYVPFPFRILTKTKPRSKYKFICISERLKRVCLINNIPEENIWCRPNPIDESKFFPISETEKQKLKEKLLPQFKDKKIVSYIAKIIPRKNHIFLLDVIQKLPQDFALFLGGPLTEKGIKYERDSNLAKQISETIKNKHLEDRVIFQIGFFENIDQYYKISDVYLFPTKAEGLGTPLLEAIACGTPVVANKIEGITNIWIKENHNGFLSSLDADEFAKKILLASKFTSQQKNQEAKKISDIAGTTIIDKGYLDVLSSMYCVS